MAKGLRQHQHRNQGLNAFGKELTRRSGSCCELCEACNVKLVIHEVPPVPSEPELEHCLFVCEECDLQITNPKRRNVSHWHCLSKAVWNPEPAIQVMAVWMARQLADEAWVKELLDQLYLQPEIEAWVDNIDS